MDGWTRLKVVLSVLYWAFAAFISWRVHALGVDAQDGSSAWLMLGFFAAIYAAAALIWWAFAGFRRRA